LEGTWYTERREEEREKEREKERMKKKREKKETSLSLREEIVHLHSKRKG
jgi:hypothetical protein